MKKKRRNKGLGVVSTIIYIAFQRVLRCFDGAWSPFIGPPPVEVATRRSRSRKCCWAEVIPDVRTCFYPSGKTGSSHLSIRICQTLPLLNVKASQMSPQTVSDWSARENPRNVGWEAIG